MYFVASLLFIFQCLQYSGVTSSRNTTMNILSILRPWEATSSFMFVEYNLLYYLELVILLPLHIIFIRPFISYYIPGTHTRMGMGMLVVMLMLAVSLGIDIIAHQEDGSLSCMLSTNELESNHTHASSALASFYYIITIQQTISRLFELITLANINV